jgi:hypothetical protein
LFSGTAWIREAHRQVSQGHRHRRPPPAVLDALGNVLREPQRLCGRLQPLQTYVEMSLRQVHVELLAKPRSAGRVAQGAGGQAKLCGRMLRTHFARCEEGSLDGESCDVER